MHLTSSGHTDTPRRRSLWTFAMAALLGVAVVLTGCGGDDAAESTAQSDSPSLPSGELEVEDPWARPAPSGGNSALYMTLANGQDTPDTLSSVTLPIADRVEVHESYQKEDGTSGMRPVDTLAVAPKSRLALEPGGRHVMLIGLSQPLEAGSQIVLNVEFAQAGLKRLRVPIQNQPPSDSGDSMTE